MIDYIDIIRTIMIAFFISLILGPIIIPMLKLLNIGQSIREEGPKSHMAKSGTPTMGGIIMVIALIITVISSGVMNRDMYVLLLSALGFGLIGFVDDYIKVVKKGNLALIAYQKLIAQATLAVIPAIYQAQTSILGTQVLIPFVANRYLDVGVFYRPFIAFVTVGTVNWVTLTDGLDVLASVVTVIILSLY